MVLCNNLNELRLHFIKKKNKINVRLTFRVRVPHSLVAGCILSKYPDGQRCPLTLKGMVGYVLHLPEMSFWCLCASQHSGIEWFAFDEYEFVDCIELAESHERFRSNTRRAGTRGCANRIIKEPV